MDPILCFNLGADALQYLCKSCGESEDYGPEELVIVGLLLVANVGRGPRKLLSHQAGRPKDRLGGD